MNFYSIDDDNNFLDRWFLGDINVDDNWIFTSGKPVNLDELPQELTIEFDQKGVEIDFTKTDAYGVPIISESFAEILFEYGEYIQLAPISIPNIANKYYVLIVTNSIDCVDETRSDFEKFEEGNDIRPDLVGEYEGINVLKIDVSKVNKPIFRIAKYDVEIIICEEIRQKIEALNLTGCKFVQVN